MSDSLTRQIGRLVADDVKHRASQRWERARTEAIVRLAHGRGVMVNVSITGSHIIMTNLRLIGTPPTGYFIYASKDDSSTVRIEGPS